MAQLSTKTKIGAAALAIIAVVFGVEGGFVDDRRDPGGATKNGVTEQVARDYGYRGPMKDLPEELAQEIYFKGYIQKPGFDKLIDLSPALAQEVIDSGVNTGPERASAWLQTALNSLNRRGRDYPNLKVDGRAGPVTMSAYQALQRVRGKAKACQLVIKLMDAQQGAHYLSLARDDSQFEAFMAGWVDHRIGNVPLGGCA